MRSFITQGLPYGSVTLGVCTVLFFLYFCHNYGSNQQEEIQEPFGNTGLWEVTCDPEQTPAPDSVVHRPDQDDPGEPRPSPKPYENFSYMDPELLSGLLKYGFNAIKNRSLGSKREVPDTRHKMCLQKHYPARLPTTNVIVCFHNEELNVLLWTPSSIMYLTPSRFPEEIILVDDNSDLEICS